MAVRDDDHVQLRQVDMKLPGVADKWRFVSTGIEQYPLATKLDQGRKAPRRSQVRSPGKRIRKNCHSIGRPGGRPRTRCDEEQDNRANEPAAH
jgi:hypothetical protein